MGSEGEAVAPEAPISPAALPATLALLVPAALALEGLGFDLVSARKRSMLAACCVRLSVDSNRTSGNGISTACPSRTSLRADLRGGVSNPAVDDICMILAEKVKVKTQCKQASGMKGSHKGDTRVSK